MPNIEAPRFFFFFFSFLDTDAGFFCYSVGLPSVTITAYNRSGVSSQALGKKNSSKIASQPVKLPMEVNLSWYPQVNTQSPNIILKVPSLLGQRRKYRHRSAG